MEVVMSSEWISYGVHSSEWIVSALMLVVVAWARFNSPPTNRSGTTFALFSFGLIFYYALIVALWLIVIIAVRQGSVGFDKATIWLGGLSPKVQGEFAPYAPLVAAFMIVVAAHFPWVWRIDNLARGFCIKLAAIPREADRLTLELAQTADFRPKSDRLRAHVSKTITENIGPQALNFEPDGTLAARFTRAVGLYWLFVGPNSNGMKIEFANANARSAYARIMQLGEATAARVDARYEELMQAACAYFATPRPAKELREALNRSITEVSQLTCSLIARYVLYSNTTKGKRRQRLARMGFDARRTMTIRFGLDQWVATILAVIVFSAGIMAFMPGTLLQSPGKILTISITFGLSIGCAVMGAVVVAQRFMERHEGETFPYPPIAELTAAALIVAGLSVALRIGIPIIPPLLLGDGSDLPGIFTQFRERLPGVIIPFVCTISLGLLCIYLGARPWSQLRVVAFGALGNGLAFMAGGLLVAWMLDDQVLGQFYADHARLRVVLTTGLTGFVIGAMVLLAFKRSERARRDDAEHAAESARAGIAGLVAVPAPEELDPAAAPRADVAARNYGGYMRANVAHLEGRYVCFRPALHRGRRHQRVSRGAALGRRRVVPDVRREGPRGCRPRAARPGLYPGWTAVHQPGDGRRRGDPAGHGVAPGAGRIRARPDHDAVQSRRHEFHAGKRADRTHARRGQDPPARLHPERRPRLRLLPPGAGSRRARVRLLCDRAATGRGAKTCDRR
jgi:uncharacterized membrane protein YidH (DUF202 family)